MGTVNLIFNLLFSIFGVVFIVGTGLSTLFSKRKHLEKDLDYKKSFVACVLGILFIIGGITGHIYAVFLVIIMISTPFFWYAKKKYPESTNTYLWVFGIIYSLFGLFFGLSL